MNLGVDVLGRVTPKRCWPGIGLRSGTYDLEVDTSTTSPARCAEMIRTRVEDGPPPTAFAQLAASHDGR